MSDKDKNIKKETEQLEEVKLSWAGKLFFASVAASIGASAYKGYKAGQTAVKLPIKIKGTPQQIKAVMDAITSSVAFQREIQKPNATIDSVLNKLKLRNLSKQQFFKLTGKKWPV